MVNMTKATDHNVPINEWKTLSMRDARAQLPEIASAFWDRPNDGEPIIVSDNGVNVAVLVPTWLAVCLAGEVWLTSPASASLRSAEDARRLDLVSVARSLTAHDLDSWSPVIMSEARRLLADFARAVDPADFTTWRSFGAFSRPSVRLVPLSTFNQFAEHIEEWRDQARRHLARELEDELRDDGVADYNRELDFRYNTIRKSLARPNIEAAARAAYLSDATTPGVVDESFSSVAASRPKHLAPLELDSVTLASLSLKGLASLDQLRKEMSVAAGLALTSVFGESPELILQFAERFSMTEIQLLDLAELGLDRIEATSL